MKKNYYLILALFTLSLFIFIPNVQADSCCHTYEVGTNNLNVRSAPDHQAEVVGQLHLGDRLTSFQEKYGWVQTYYKGEKAWVASQFLTKQKETSAQNNVAISSDATLTITADSVRLRSGPGTNHKIIGFTSHDNTYQLIDTNKNGSWFNILLDDGTTAWVAAWLTNQGTDEQPSANKKGKFTKKATKTKVTKNKTDKTKMTEKATEKKKTTNKTNNKPTKTNTNKSLKGYNIILDPGHGGTDPGSIAVNGKQEKYFTLRAAQAIANKLREAGATVLLTRSDDKYISIKDRVKISHSYNTDAFISIHYDAYTSNNINGTSTHYFSDGPDAELARSIQTALDKHTNLNGRGLMQSPYYVLRENKNLAVLVELGFMTNENDLAIIQSESHTTNIAEAITQGLINYFHN